MEYQQVCVCQGEHIDFATTVHHFKFRVSEWPVEEFRKLLMWCMEHLEEEYDSIQIGPTYHYLIVKEVDDMERVAKKLDGKDGFVYTLEDPDIRSGKGVGKKPK